MINRETRSRLVFQDVINDICALNWGNLVEDDLVNVAWVYYYFSIQFRESLEIARKLYPDDDQLVELDGGERDTDNLSPWPGVAATGERMDHDEFMRRTLGLGKFQQIGSAISRLWGKRICRRPARWISTVGQWLSQATRMVALNEFFALS